MRVLFRYPQASFPYQELVSQSAARSRMQPEFELWHTAVLAGNRFFDIEITYAKAAPDDILICATATNRGVEPATLHLLPTIWFRNTWTWGRNNRKPILQEAAPNVIEAVHHELGNYVLHCEKADAPGRRGDFLFTENESNFERLWAVPNHSPFAKDSINDAIIQDRGELVNPGKVGTKAAAHYQFTIPPNETRTIRLRLTRIDPESASGPLVARGGSARTLSSASKHNPVREAPTGVPEARALTTEELRGGVFSDFDEIVTARKMEADEFYAELAGRVA